MCRSTGSIGSRSTSKRRLNLLGMALSFWATFAAGTALLAVLGKCIHARWHLGPICGWELWWILVTSPEVLIFLAFMITDPKTTPSAPRRRLVFGAGIGALSAVLVALFETELQVKVAILASLVIACGLRPLLERLPTEIFDPHRLAPANRAASVVGVVLAFAGLLGVTSTISDVEPPPADAGAPPLLISDADVPPVTVDESVDDITPPLDEAAARALGADVVNALAVERLAVETGDARLAATGSSGPRRDGRIDRIEARQRPDRPDYRFDSIVVSLDRPTPQSPPVLMAAATGTAANSSIDDVPVVEQYVLEYRNGRYLLADPLPTLIADDGGVETPDLELPPAIPLPEDIVSADALGGLHFTDVTAEAGLATAQANLRPPDDIALVPGGAAAEDIDGDGDIDLYLTRLGVPNLLFLNNGDGGFVEAAAEYGIDGDGVDGDSGPVFADIDADGDLDLIVTSATSNTILLYVRDGDRFEEQAALRGLAPASVTDTPGNGVALADIDGDGDLDLFVARWRLGELTIGPRGDHCARDRSAVGTLTAPAGDASQLFVNDGTGHFVDATADWGLAFGDIAAFQPVFADGDGDGDPDLFLTGDFCTSRVYRNDGDRFGDMTARLDVGTDENGMGSIVADFDRDGRLDWFITSISYPRPDGSCPNFGGNTSCSGNRLYLNRPSGFVDATDEYGLRNGYWGWGVIVEDLNNDGYPEVAHTNGFSGRIPYFRTDPTVVWLGTATPPYARVTKQVGLIDDDAGKAMVPLDYDDDGDPDLFIVNSDAPSRLWRNDTPPGRGWVLDLGPELGVFVREIRAGGSFQSGDPALVHIGLGETADDTVRAAIYWPGEDEPHWVDLDVGQTTVVERAP
jgi:hypothetical protein